MEIEHTVNAEKFERFAPSAFDASIGKTIAFNHQPDGACLLDAKISDDGSSVVFKLDVLDPVQQGMLAGLMTRPRVTVPHLDIVEVEDID